MRVYQAGSHLTEERGADGRATGRGGRRAGGSGRSASSSPRTRARAILSVLTLLLSTAIALAPPLLAKTALNDAINGGNQLYLIVGLFLVAGLLNWGMTYAQTYLTGWVGRADAGRPEDEALRAPPAALARLLRAEPRRRRDQPADERRRGARPARHRRRVHARPEHADPGRHRDPALHPRLAARARDAAGDPGDERRHRLLPPLLDAGVPRRPRAARPRHRDARRGHRRHACRPGVRARAGRTSATSARSASATAQSNQQTVVLSAWYFPFVDLLSTVALAVVLGYGGHLYFQGDISIGTLFAFMLYVQNFFDPVQALSQLYGTFLSATAALDKINGLLDEEPEVVDAPGARDLGHIDGPRRVRGRALHLRPRRRGAARDRPRRPRRDDRCPRGTHRRREVDDREAPRPLLRPDARADHDRRRRSPRRHAGVAAAPARRRPAGGLPVRRHRAREHRVRPARTRPTSRSSPPRRRSAPTSSSPASRTATRPSSASAARGSRSASASSSRSRARCSPTRASSSSTRRPRRSTSAPSGGSRSRSASSSPAGRRSSSRTASRRSATRT